MLDGSVIIHKAINATINDCKAGGILYPKSMLNRISRMMDTYISPFLSLFVEGEVENFASPEKLWRTSWNVANHLEGRIVYRGPIHTTIGLSNVNNKDTILTNSIELFVKNLSKEVKLFSKKYEGLSKNVPSLLKMNTMTIVELTQVIFIY